MARALKVEQTTPTLTLVKPTTAQPPKPPTKKAKAKIDSATARAALGVRRSHYWHRDGVNQFVGYRKMTTDRPGNWVAKVQKGRLEESKPLGKLEHIPEDGRFKEAQRLARLFFAEVDLAGGMVGPDGETRSAALPSRKPLREVLDDRVQWMAKQPKDNAAAASRAAELCFVKVFGSYKDGAMLDMPIGKIRQKDWEDWRDYMLTMPSRNAGGHVIEDGGVRKVASVNRELVYVRGNGTTPHLVIAQLVSEAKLHAEHIPFQGGSQALTNLIAGQIDFISDNVPVVLTSIEGGLVKPLGVSSSKRIPSLPNIPTIAEQGVPNFDYQGWILLVGPSRLPPAIVARLNSEVEAIMKMPDVRKRFNDLGLVPMDMPRTDLAGFIGSESDKWKEVVRVSGAAETTR